MLQLTLSFRTNTAGSEGQAGAGQSQPCKEPRLRSAGSFPSTPGRTHFQNDKQAKSRLWGAQQFQTWLDSKALLSKPDTCLQLLLTGHSLSDSTSFQGQCHRGHWSTQQQESSPSKGPGLLCPLPSELQQLNDPLQSCSNNQEFKQKPGREAGATLPLSGLLQHTTELKCCQGPAYTVLKYLKNEISQSCGVRAGRNKWFLSPCSGLNKKTPQTGSTAPQSFEREQREGRTDSNGTSNHFRLDSSWRSSVLVANSSHQMYSNLKNTNPLLQ